MFTKQLQGLLLHANINQQNCLLIKWYLPVDICQVKNNLLTFSQNSESLATWIQSKKDWCCTEFSYYYKGKISLNSKIRETFLVSHNFDCFYSSLYCFNNVNRVFDG